MKTKWLKWTTDGWRMLSDALRGVDQQGELKRLVDGLEQVRRVDSVQSPIIEAADDRKCACCGGSRCRAWRDSRHTTGCGGHTEDDKCWRTGEDGVRADGCGGEAEPLPVGVPFRTFMDRAVITPGRHTIQYVVKHAVPWTWNPIPLRTRVILWPMQYARKLGRPVQIGSFARVAMP